MAGSKSTEKIGAPRGHHRMPARKSIGRDTPGRAGEYEGGAARAVLGGAAEAGSFPGMSALLRLSVGERLRIIDALWNSIGAKANAAPESERFPGLSDEIRGVLLPLGVDERIQLAQDLWSRIGEEADANPDILLVPERQIQEVMRRIAAHRKNPERTVPLETVLRALERSLQ